MKKIAMFMVFLGLLLGFKVYASSVGNPIDGVATEVSSSIVPCCIVEDIDPINEDTTSPIITLSDYNTNPTNQDITVTANTNEGSLNTTSHTFTENGSFEFIATDIAGNMTSLVVTITNIDKVAPIFGFLPVDLTNPTNHDITIRVVLGNVNPDEIVTFNATSHTFTENGSFEFVATDEAGNTTSRIVTVTNIIKSSSSGRNGSYIRKAITPVVAIAPVIPVGKVLGETTFKFTKLMKVGSRGNEVMELQKRLASEGLYAGAVDGIFGKITKKGVIDFQVKNEVEPKGIVGPMTREMLNK